MNCFEAKTPLVRPERSLEDICRELECYETPEWTIRAVLREEELVGDIEDPCCGPGVMSKVAREVTGREILSADIHDYGYPCVLEDFLMRTRKINGTVFMNPPFSKAVEFVLKAKELGASKIVMFQRLAWWESGERRKFWDEHPPRSVYICGDRASCWRHDLPVNERGKRYDPRTGKELAGSSTAHAWFIFEAGWSGETKLKRLYKS